MTDPKVFKLGVGNHVGIPRSGTVLGFKGRDYRVNKCIFHINVWSITQTLHSCEWQMFYLGTLQAISSYHTAFLVAVFFYQYYHLLTSFCKFFAVFSVKKLDVTST